MTEREAFEILKTAVEESCCSNIIETVKVCAVAMAEEVEKREKPLLDACKAVLAWADRECMPQGDKNDGPWEQVEAAIAIVEGKEKP